MNRIAFDNDKYLSLQVEKIKERINHFDDKLYLEFGGKLFDDYHASRTLPGFQPDAKIKALLALKEQLEVIIVIGARDIQSGKMRSDVGLSYEEEVLRMIDAFHGLGLFVGSVVITQYARQVLADIFKANLENRGIKVHLHYPIPGYPSNTELILSDQGFGKNDYIETKRPLIVVTAPGPGSGKMATCLSQLYHEHQRGINAGYAKYETFPVWNLPLRHPVNLAYEAATADINDVIMIDPFHLEAYQTLAVNYNRDIEVFPVLKSIFDRIYHKSPYQSPTDMGINMAGYCIVDDDIAKQASKQEILRRYFDTKCDVKNGILKESAIEKIELIMQQMGITIDDRKAVKFAQDREREAQSPAMAVELTDGTIITGKTSSLLDASAATILNALKHYAKVDKDLKLISPSVIKPIQTLRTNYLGIENPRLHLNEVLIALSINANSNPAAEKALQQLPKLAGAQAHSTVMLTTSDVKNLKRLHVDITTDPVFRARKYTEI